MVYNSTSYHKKKHRKAEKMLNFNFLLETTPGSSSISFFVILAAFVLMMVVMTSRQKKQSKQEAEMRNSLAVGDEVTTIGGIIGKVVSIKEETFVLETTREKTHIRFLKGAVRSVDVKVADIAAAQTAEKSETSEEK